MTQNLSFDLFAIFTNVSITGTSVSTPTVVARAAGLVVPNKAMATATASSKKLDARSSLQVPQYQTAVSLVWPFQMQ
ncbi:MAG: hypothetical protein IJQ21_00205 [Lachnospiraceae bacterium]|nr:hypothetical protein [Lachnospiraceae bacterium]